jgi:hypothetical protein
MCTLVEIRLLMMYYHLDRPFMQNLLWIRTSLRLFLEVARDYEQRRRVHCGRLLRYTHCLSATSLGICKILLTIYEFLIKGDKGIKMTEMLS